MATVGLSGRVIAFLLLLAVITALTLAMIVGWFSPGTESPRPSAGRSPATTTSAIAQRLRQGAAPDRRSLVLRQLLLFGQVTLATLLLVGAALLVATFHRISNVDPGFDPQRLAMMRVALPAPEGEGSPGSTEDRFRQQRDRLLDSVQAVPGVENAALSADAPLSTDYSATVVSPQGAVRDVDEPYGGGTRVYRHLVTPGYFDTLSLPLLRGRDFDSGDSLETGSEGVGIVSAALAQRLWPGQEALGQRFKFGSPADAQADDGTTEWVTVVGVVADARQRSLIPQADGPPEDPDVYFAMNQFEIATPQVIARTATPPEGMLLPIEGAARSLGGDVVTYGLETMDQRIQGATSRERFAGTLLGFFAIVALFLSALGIYGHVAYQLSTRLRDVGIRLALGASTRRVVHEIVTREALGIGAAVTLGLLAAAALTRVLESQLYGIGRFDPQFYLGVALFVTGFGVLAAWLPARQAARIDPVRVLKAD
jgi:predicted permease